MQGKKKEKKEKGEGTEGGDINGPHVPWMRPPLPPLARAGAEYSVCQTQFQDISRARSIGDAHLNARRGFYSLRVWHS